MAMRRPPTMSPEDYLRYCKVERSSGGQFCVLGDLEWTSRYKKVYAECPTHESAESARRLLSGEAERAKEGA
jgi:hypothetical protein